MSVKTNQYINALVQDASRGPSQSIWGDCPLADFQQGMGGGIGTAGMLVEDDFMQAGQPALNANSSAGRWACWADTGSTLTDANEEGGVLKLLNGTAGDQITLASLAGGFKMVSGASGFPLGQKLWFEARVALSSISSTVQGMFVGLADNTSTQITSTTALIMAATANTLVGTKGMFGFFNRAVASPSEWCVAYQVAGGSTVFPTNLQTLMNTVTGAVATAYAAVSNGNGTGFVKLGFKFDPTADNPALLVPSLNSGDGTVTQTVGGLLKPIIQFFVNGQLCGTFLDPSMLQTSRFPTKRMTPVISFGQASASGTVATAASYIDWIRVAQLASF